jgi:hypothetical protein
MGMVVCGTLFNPDRGIVLLFVRHCKEIRSKDGDR